MKPWTEAHRREALRRTYDIAAELTGAGGDFFPHISPGNVETVRHFRATLAGHARLDTARIDREERRVRGLAEGRLVRENGWRGNSRDGSVLAWTTSPAVAATWKSSGARVVRVTRIRRAVKP